MAKEPRQAIGVPVSSSWNSQARDFSEPMNNLPSSRAISNGCISPRIAAISSWSLSRKCCST